MWKSWYKKDLYICPFIGDTLDDEGFNVPLYDKPIYLGKLNIQPLSGQSTSAFGNTVLRDFGDKVEKMQSVLIDYNKWLGVFHEDDVAFIEIKPDKTLPNGTGANYKLVSVRNQNRKIVLYFEKFIDKE